MYWIYRALTRSGQEITAAVAGEKKDILEKLSEQQLSLIELRIDFQRAYRVFLSKRKPAALSLAAFFEDFSNMLETGMGVVQALSILKESCKDASLVNQLTNLQMSIYEGKSLAESLRGSRAFPWIVTTTLSAGENSGRLVESTKILGKYFRSTYQIKNKLQQALVYPSIVFTLLLVVMSFISLHVIPQIKNLLPTDSLHNPATQWILTLSLWLQEYVYALGVVSVLAIAGLCYFQKQQRERFYEWVYQWPILGNILKESALSIYLLNLSILLKSSVSLLKALEDLNALERSPVSVHFAKSRESVLGGSTFWQSIEEDYFFPAIVAATLRRSEEMVRIEEYCLSLSEYFNRRVHSKIEGLLHLVQPALLALGGIFLVAIALGFLLPIYSSLTTVANGQ